MYKPKVTSRAEMGYRKVTVRHVGPYEELIPTILRMLPDQKLMLYIDLDEDDLKSFQTICAGMDITLTRLSPEESQYLLEGQRKALLRLLAQDIGENMIVLRLCDARGPVGGDVAVRFLEDEPEDLVRARLCDLTIRAVFTKRAVEICLNEEKYDAEAFVSRLKEECKAMRGA